MDRTGRRGRTGLAFPLFKPLIDYSKCETFFLYISLRRISLRLLDSIGRPPARFKVAAPAKAIQHASDPSHRCLPSVQKIKNNRICHLPAPITSESAVPTRDACLCPGRRRRTLTRPRSHVPLAAIMWGASVQDSPNSSLPVGVRPLPDTVGESHRGRPYTLLGRPRCPRDRCQILRPSRLRTGGDTCLLTHQRRTRTQIGLRFGAERAAPNNRTPGHKRRPERTQSTRAHHAMRRRVTEACRHRQPASHQDPGSASACYLFTTLHVELWVEGVQDLLCHSLPQVKNQDPPRPAGDTCICPFSTQPALTSPGFQKVSPPLNQTRPPGRPSIYLAVNSSSPCHPLRLLRSYEVDGRVGVRSGPSLTYMVVRGCGGPIPVPYCSSTKETKM